MSTIFNEDEVHTLVVLPPDGGWGLMVVFCSFICHFVIDGNIYTFGLFLNPISDTFDINMTQISFVGSVMGGMCYIVGPFASACVNRFDFRLVAVLGCLMAMVGYVIAAFSINYPMFLVGNGIIIGSAYGILYVPALVMPSLYFAKYRAVAVSIATCGTGIGTFVVPTAVTPLVSALGWRHSYLCMIGVVGLAALASLAFIPLEPKRVYEKDGRMKDKMLGTSRMNFKKDQRHRCACCHWANTYFPKAEDVVEYRLASFEDVDTMQFDIDRRASSELSTRLSAASWVSRGGGACYNNCMSCLCCTCCQTNTRAMYRDDIFYGGSIVDLKRREKRPKKLTKKQLEARKKQAEASAKKAAAKAAKVAAEVEGMKATTSKAKGKEKEEEEDDYVVNLNQYHMSVTRVTTNTEMYDKYTCCCCCSVSGIRALTSLLDFRILKSIAFLILSFNGFFFTLGYMIPFMFVVDRATDAGIERTTAVMYLSYIGISNTVARILGGLLPVLMNVNCTVFIIVCCILQGACTIVSGLYLTNWYQMTYVVAYGFLAAPQLALRSVIVVDVFGLENLTNIFGLQLVLSGVAAMIGPTVGGMLRDYTQSYTYSFYFAGSCIAFSAFLLAFLQPARNWETRTGFVNF